jgi:uncharacterized protein YecE (DUF72 family)
MIRIGTSGWAYSSWKPAFYPPKTPAAKFLEYYSSQLNCVEVNYTFRTWAKPELLQKWADGTPQDFVFAMKANQRITHIKRLRDVRADVISFCDSLVTLREAGRLGPVLFQLPPNLKANRDMLSEFLSALPNNMRAAMEFRNPGWFETPILRLLEEHNVALCVAESDDLQTPENRTADFAYFRFRQSNYSPEQIEVVRQRLAKAAESGDVYAFMKHEETPEGALNARTLLNTLR